MLTEYSTFGLHVQVRVINRDKPGVMQHSLTTLSSIALLRTDDLAHNVQISSVRPAAKSPCSGVRVKGTGA